MQGSYGMWEYTRDHSMCRINEQLSPVLKGDNNTKILLQKS
jgi:hypothetical protein